MTASNVPRETLPKDDKDYGNFVTICQQLVELQNMCKRYEASARADLQLIINFRSHLLPIKRLS